jgi:hypothetical protein
LPDPLREFTITTGNMEVSMNRRAVITALSLAPLAHAASPAAERKKFIGMWKLISGESKDQVTGEVLYPWGKNPFGRLMYDEAARVFVQ